jgi:hypothetical protein
MILSRRGLNCVNKKKKPAGVLPAGLLVFLESLARYFRP